MTDVSYMHMTYVFRNFVLNKSLYYSSRDERCFYTQHTTCGRICRDSVEIRAIFKQSKGRGKTSILRARRHIANLFDILLLNFYNACVVAVLSACSE